MFKKFKEKVMGGKDRPSTESSVQAPDTPTASTQPRQVQQKFQPPAEEPVPQQYQYKQQQQPPQQQKQQYQQQQEEEEPYYQEEEEDPTPVLQVRPRSQIKQQVGSPSTAGLQRPGLPAPLTTCTFTPQTLTHMRSASTSLSDQAFLQNSSALGASRTPQAAVPRMIHPGSSGNREYARDSSGSTDMGSQPKPSTLATRGTSNNFVRTSGSIETSSPRTTSHSLVDANTFNSNNNNNNNYNNNSLDNNILEGSSNNPPINSYHQDVRTNRNFSNNSSSNSSGSLAATPPSPPSPSSAPARPPSAGPSTIGDSSTTGEAAPLKKQSSFKKITSMFRRPPSALKPPSVLTNAPTPTAFGDFESQPEDTPRTSASKKSGAEVPVQSSRGSFLNIIPRIATRAGATGQVKDAESTQSPRTIGTFLQAPFQRSPSSSHHNSNSSSQQHISNHSSGAWEEGGGRGGRAVGAVKAWEMGPEEAAPIRISPATRSIFASRNHLFENHSEGFPNDGSNNNLSASVARSTGSFVNNQAGSPITGVRGMRNQGSLSRQDTTSSGGIQDDLELMAAGGSGSNGMPGLQGTVPGVSSALNRMGARANAASLVEELPMGVRRLRVGTGSTKATISRAGSAVAGEVFLDSESSSPRMTTASLVM